MKTAVKMNIKILILIFSLFFFQSCGFLNQLKSDSELTKKIENKYEIEKRPVNLKEITDFDWDTYTILYPYTNVKDYAKTKNLNFTNIYQNDISYSDYFELLVFIKDNKSVKICELRKFTPISENYRLQ
ncbi:hypothetical protein MTP09_06130 [Chryseobacterium suipulveris]|uniref:Lipoprotein n=1 Tax=Chryseobacterium suipulveris TaxID=2929800 RepID=A0ABY4BSP1_9FLAO|nr:hypothetical protein [Chryseobacterium suipulveris]UOE42213.1 hypothetical protein MTP09_06130 [Chryseobacterium suipulveris]